MLCLLFLSCLPFLVMVCGKTEKDTDTLIHVILREQASMIKHCMSNVCTRNMYNPGRPKKPWTKLMVAFSAYPGSDLTKIRGETKVVFGSTRTNIGNAYDPKTGVFTAPVDGVYAFHWSLMISKGKYISTYISVNGKNQAVLYGDARNFPAWYFPSQSYVAHLKKDDRVYLITSDGTSDGYIHKYSTFTGYRL